jgi:hypothetical protein
MPIDYFIDESIHAPANKGSTLFYIFALVGLDRNYLRQARLQINELVVRNKWHSAGMLGKPSGRKIFERTTNHFNSKSQLVIFLVEPNPSTDLNAEITRSEMMLKIVSFVLELDPNSFLIFEKRGSGGHQALDKRTVRTNLNAFELSRVRFEKPDREPLLWLPDMLASAYRQFITKKRTELLNAYSGPIEVIQLP